MPAGSEDPCPDRGEPDGSEGFEPGLVGGRGRRLLLEAAVLAALREQSAHGYDLRRTLVELTEGFMVVDSGNIYRLLRRLEQEGLVESTWTEGEFGPQRREYRLTPEGRENLLAWRPYLEARERAFRSVIEAINRLVVAKAGDRAHKG